MIGTPSPRRSMKYRLSSEPRTPLTDIRPSMDASVWLRVDCRTSMPSTVRLFGSAPGDWISRRSSNMERRIRAPLIE